MGMLDYIYLLPILTIVVLFFGGMAAFFVHPETFPKTRMSVFISVMGSLAVVILAFNVILQTLGLQTQVSLSKSQYTKEAIDKLWLLPNQTLEKSREARPEFLASLYYNNAELHKLTKNKRTQKTVQSELEEQYISILLLQCWEDYLTLRGWDNTGDQVWITNFLQWAQSQYLQQAFDILKYNYAPTTIEFAELMFEFADQIPVPCNDPEIYRVTANKMLNDPRLKVVYSNREKA